MTAGTASSPATSRSHVPPAEDPPPTEATTPPSQVELLAATYPFEGGSLKILGVSPSDRFGGTGRITVEFTATERYTGAHGVGISLHGPDEGFAHYFHCLYMAARTTVVETLETADFGGTRWDSVLVGRHVSSSCGKDPAPTY